MTTLHLDDNLAAALKARADAQGLSVEAYLRSLTGLPQDVSPAPANGDAAREFDAALDELFARDTRPLPAVALTYSRGDIYHDHD
jgi:plasmid stability protein